MRKCEVRPYVALTLFASALLAVATLLSCSNGSMRNPFATTTGTITTSISDPPTCAAPGGPFAHAWVTVTRVRAHISSDAGPDDSGWVDLVNLTSSPRQIDLLSLASTACILNQLGSTSGLPPGRYQQIRLHLLANNATGVTVTPQNNCGASNSSGPFNCVALTASPTSPLPLLLSSEAQTGLKIPPGQIAGGAINLEAGQSADLDIHFNACSSVLRQGNGQYRLKPTLHVGAVALNQNSISGRVVVKGTTTPIPNAIVLLEKPGSDSIDRVFTSALTGADGTFVFCTLHMDSGPYDVVVAAKTTTSFNPTIVGSVPLGTALGDIPLTAETGTGGTITSNGTGLVTTQDGSQGIVIDVVLSVLEQVTLGSSTPKVTIPVFDAPSQPPSFMTAPSGGTTTCPPNTDCFAYSLKVPLSKPAIGTLGTSGVSYVDPPSGDPSYDLEGRASCTNSPQAASSLVFAAGTVIVGAPLVFTGCTAPSL